MGATITEALGAGKGQAFTAQARCRILIAVASGWHLHWQHRNQYGVISCQSKVRSRLARTQTLNVVLDAGALTSHHAQGRPGWPQVEHCLIVGISKVTETFI